MNKYEIYKENLKEYNDFKESQRALKAKHNISSDKIIIEKSNTIKFLINFCKNILRISIYILAIGFMSIGIITMLYSETREKFFKIINRFFLEVFKM